MWCIHLGCAQSVGSNGDTRWSTVDATPSAREASAIKRLARLKTATQIDSLGYSFGSLR